MLIEEIPRKILADLFEQFDALPLTPDSRLAEGTQTGESDEIENYFRGRSWPQLIYYFKRWDPSLSTASFLTPLGFASTLPAYLFAALLWPDILDTGVLITILLAPALKEPSGEGCFEEVSGLSPDQCAGIMERRKQLFTEAQNRLGPRQRAAVSRALKYLVHHDPGYPESRTSSSRAEMNSAIERLWDMAP
jgi:hypothetical protein